MITDRDREIINYIDKYKYATIDLKLSKVKKVQAVVKEDPFSAVKARGPD
jgi:hypothetical protein